jgi:cysteine desulfurase
MVKLPIYMDHHASTPIDPRVLDVMLPVYTADFGNAASRNHVFGRRSATLVEEAREKIAVLVGANDPEEIVFTSGATESDNLALKGVARLYREKGDHIITTAIEHKAVLDAARALQAEGFRVTFLSVDHDGRIDLEALENAITRRTILISVMAANNEVGVIQDLEAVGKIAKARGIFFHTDAAQAAGKIPLDVEALRVDLMSFTAHKMYGPKGIGALYVRKRNPRVRLAPLIHGGGHERGLRSGTLNVPGAVGFGKACELAREELAGERARLLALREKLRRGFLSRLDDVHLNGSLEHRLPGNLNLSFAYVEADSLLVEVADEIALSSGAACASATLEPSHVLKALGVPEDLAHTSIRFGLGRFNTDEEVEYVLDRIETAVKRLRQISPLYEQAKQEVDQKSLEWQGR